MPPKKTTFSRIEPAPRQTRLSSRRSLPLTHRRDSPPKLQKRQSTLTQLDFIPSDDTPSITIPNSTDDEEESEYEEMQPRKKPRLSGGKKGKARDPGQSTLTQKWDVKAAMAARRDFQDSDDDVMIVEDEEQEQKQIKPRRPKSKGHTQTQSELFLSGVMDSDPESDSQASPLPQKRVAFAPSSDAGKVSTRPTTAGSASNPQTPQRQRRLEIPSSETPSSLKLSKHSPKQHKMYERSPLKERSSNVPSLKRSRSPSVEKKADDGGKPKAVPAGETGDENTEEQPWTATLAITPKKDPEPRKRQLQRVSTIQESDHSDMEIDLSPIQQKTEVEPAPPSQEPVQRKRRSLQRVSNIQDSEENSSDLIEPDSVQPLDPTGDGSQEIAPALAPSREDEEPGENEMNLDSLPSDPPEVDSSPKRASQSTPPELEDIQGTVSTELLPASQRPAMDVDNNLNLDSAGTAQSLKAGLDPDELDEETDDDLDPRVPIENQYGEDEDDEEDDDYVDEDMYPQTYDPVSAALELDAARYGRDTQYESDVGDADDDGSVVAASDGGFAEESAKEIEFVPSSQPGESRIRSSQEENALPANATTDQKHTSPGPVDDSGYSSEHTTAKANKVVHFAPADNGPRPSQISTVCDDTQSPRSRPHSAHGWQTQKSAPAWPDTLSSSPFPLPPGFVMKSQRKGETQSSGFPDFSLPPPPPLLFSSSRVEEEGS